MDKCTSIQKVREISGSDLLLVTINNSTQAYWIYKYEDALKYLNQDVVVDYRKDILDGNIQQFIKTFTIPTEIKTLSKEDNIKLFTDMHDDNSNVHFSDIELESTAVSATVFCISQEFLSSAKAKWMELKIRDMDMKIGILRIFDYENIAAELAGKYVMTNLSRNKYGFQSDFVIEAPGTPADNIEIKVARQFCENMIAADAASLSFVSKYNLFDNLLEYVDYEQGYAIVRLAMELAMTDAMINISNDFDILSVKQALLASYGYTTRESILSPIVNNVFLAQSIAWDDKPKVIQLLDIPNENTPFEGKIFTQVKELVDTILKQRKEI